MLIYGKIKIQTETETGDHIVSFFKMLGFMMSRKFASYVEMAGTSNSLLHYGPKKKNIEWTFKSSFC